MEEGKDKAAEGHERYKGITGPHGSLSSNAFIAVCAKIAVFSRRGKSCEFEREKLVAFR
jgi:hypothetical protein